MLPWFPRARRRGIEIAYWLRCFRPTDGFGVGPAAFELKFDAFLAIADTVNGRMLSNRGNQMHRFEMVLQWLPAIEVLAADQQERR